MAEPMTPADILASAELDGWHGFFDWGLKPEHSDDPAIQVLIRNARDYFEAFERSCKELGGALELIVGPEVRDEC
jgi:hypothetical protein